MATEQEREAVARKLHEAIAGSINLSLVARLRNADAAIAMRDAAVAEALQDATAEIATLRAKIAAVQDVVNSTTIRTRIDEAWVEKICRALDAMPATDVQDKANFAETQTIRYVRK